MSDYRTTDIIYTFTGNPDYGVPPRWRSDPADGTGTKYYHERLVQNLLTIPNDIIRALEGIGGPSLAEILKRSHTLLRHINELEKGGES